MGETVGVDIEALTVRKSLLYAEWIKALDEAAEKLDRVVSETPFPHLSGTPDTDEKVETTVAKAREWGTAVRKAYGEGERSYRHDGQGILALLQDGCEGFVELDQPAPSAPPMGGERLYYFERAFSRAPDALGAGRAIQDPGQRRIAFIRENWDEIRGTLEGGRAIVTKQAKLLVEWVGSEIRRLTGQPEPSRPATGLSDAPLDPAHLSARELAGSFGVPQGALRKALARWRKRHGEGWIENTERGSRQPKYLYQVGAIRTVLEGLRSRSVQRASGERPSKD